MPVPRPYSAPVQGAKIMFVSDVPNIDDMKDAVAKSYKDGGGSIFLGSAGHLLNNLLSSASINRYQCWIDNVFQFKPKDTKLYLDVEGKTRIVATPEFTRAREHLIELIQRERPNVVVPLGAAALYTLTNETKITKWRGSLMECPFISGQKIIPTIHPDSALREYLFRHVIIKDLVRIKRESAFPEINYPQYDLILYPTLREALDFINLCKKRAFIGFDIEVLNEELYCFSLAYDAKTAICITLHADGKAFFNPTDELIVLRALEELFRTTKACGQNLAFDCSFMFHKYGIVINPMHDTMVAQAILYPDFPKGLDFITSLWTNQPYYKDEGKKHWRVKDNPNTSTLDKFAPYIKHHPDNGETRFFIYNALDSLVCMEAICWMVPELEETGNFKTYQTQTAQIPVLTFMSERGIRINDARIDILKKETEQEIKELEEKLAKMVGASWTDKFINSPKQIMQYLYVEKGIPPVMKRKKPTTDEKALKKLSGKGVKEASIILEIRKRRKLSSTYYGMKFIEVAE